jgi:hypothetical protein
MFLAFASIGLASIGHSSSVLADPPDREPVDIPSEFTFTDAKGNNPCDFAVLLTVLTNREVQTTFLHQDGTTSLHVSGTLKVRLTNQVTGSSVDVNISGPLQLVNNSDGTQSQVSQGRSLWAFEPGIAPELPRLALISGRVVSSFDADRNFSFQSVSGQVEDLCAVLAGG